MTDLNKLIAKATEVRLKAYAPYSHFLVGTCIETQNGQLFTGCNVENASFSVAVCSEANAIAAMIAGGEKEIKQAVIVVEGPKIATSCGACRQRLAEFSSPETLIHFCDLSGNIQSYKMGELLPKPFNKAML